ncbi:unnamed protein product [Penicillium glandicola]
MRWSLLFTLIVSLFLLGGTLAAPASGPRRGDVEVANLEAREETETDPTTTASTASEASTTTQTDTSKTTADASTATEATADATASTTSSTAATTHASTNATATTSAASATSTVPSLDGTTASSEDDGADSARPTYSGGLPITPVITPAWGVGGFILMALGAVLTFIGVRKQWVQIFLSTGFLSALGVTVLIIYVMSPPVSNAVQGGYLVAVFFTGAVFGGLSLVFREICEGLGCLLGGFCLSMWFLALTPGGLLTEGGPKAGMIIAFSVGFYSLSFSHYTRPYGLIGCTSFAGATALVIGIDCYSRAGLKEFWLYIWGLNQTVFPLRTDTYPVTRGIRVELAATIIISVLGVISQVRLWNLIKERRAREEDSRRAHTRKIEEEDAEAGRRLEEKNIQERAEWELIYGNGKAADEKTSSVSETAVGDSRPGSDGSESSDNDKEGEIELKDMSSPDASGSASDGEKNCQGENDARELEAVPEEDSSQLGQPRDVDQENGAKKEGQSEGKMPRPTTPVVTHVLGEGNDASSENGAEIGSEVGTPRSKRFSGREMLSRLSWRNGNGVMTASQSQENLVDHDDANSSIQGVADDHHEMSVGCPSVISDADVHDRVEKTQQETKTAELAPEKDSTDVEIKSSAGSQPVQDAELRVDTVVAQKGAEKVITEETTVSQTAQQVSPVESIVVADSPSDKSAISAVSEKPQSPETPATDVEGDIPDTSKKTEEVKPKATLEPSPLSDPEGEKLKEVNEDRPPTTTPVKAEFIPESKVVSLPKPKAEPKVKVLKTLDASTVKCIPEQTSRVIHSYRTNEWAKHLADADTPEMEPIEFEPELEAENPEEAHETAAYVDVGGLLQTPLTGQPPPIVNRPEFNDMDNQQSAYITSLPSPDIPRSKTRTGPQGLTKAKPALNQHDLTASVNLLRSTSGPLPTQEMGLTSTRNVSTPLLTLTTTNEVKETEPSPRWNGPPPLLAVREDMVRNRMSSTSNRFDPWAGRNISRQSLPEIAPIVSPISPPLSIPEERGPEHEQAQPNEDDIPLSKRRALLQRQTAQSPSAASLESLEAAPFPVYPPPAPAGELNRSASRMAAWRQSVREEITQKRDPLALQSRPLSPASPPDRQRAPWNSVQQMREASSAQLGDAIADGMQRGKMTDLHRQAMRPRPPANRAPVESIPSFVRAQRRQCVPISGPPSLLRPPAVRLANPVNHVPRITPITIRPHQSDESLPLGIGHSRDAHPLLSVPERRRSRLTPSPSSLLVERSQGETESGRTSIALPRRHRRSEEFAEMAAAFAGSAARETENLRPPEAVHLTENGTRQNDRPRHAQSQTSLRSQSQIASVPSHTGHQPADVAEELAWGPAHPCFPHVNPHVPIGSREHMTTRVIRIRRDWMIKGDLAPTFSNLYPEILDPLLSEQEFRRVISTVNDGVIKAFDPFSFRNWFDGALGLLTGWVWDDLNAPATKSQLQHVEAWLENWNREVGAKDGVHIWSLRRTAYMSLDIQIPDPKVGIVPSEAPSAPNTRPSTGIGAGS